MERILGSAGPAPAAGRRTAVSQDPWNWNMPSRSEGTMSMQTLNAQKDMTKVKVNVGITTKREQSKNMDCGDIKGALPKQTIK